jgi:hypothetical protein
MLGVRAEAFSMVTHGPAGLPAANLLSGQLFGWDAAVRRGWERGRETVSTGFRSLDRLLPAGGVRLGSLIEWLAADDASGAIALACAVACRLAGSRGTGDEAAAPAATILIVDRGGRFYPPAVLPWLDGGGNGMGSGGGRPRFVVARPSTDDDEIWAIDQALRCPGVAAVLAWPGRVHPTAMRRWQLAARAGGAVGLLVRGMDGHAMSSGRRPEWRCEPAHAKPTHSVPMHAEPTWAEARVAVRPLAAAAAVGEPSAGPSVRRLRLSLAGGPWAGEAMLEERATELFLDMATGREAAGRRRAAAVTDAGRLREWASREGLECRAS